MSPKLWAIVRREYLERVRTKAFVIATFLGPAIMAGLMLIPAMIATRQRGKPQRLVALARGEHGRPQDQARHQKRADHGRDHEGLGAHALQVLAPRDRHEAG